MRFEFLVKFGNDNRTGLRLNAEFLPLINGISITT
jgi:hypothetical protein